MAILNASDLQGVKSGFSRHGDMAGDMAILATLAIWRHGAIRGDGDTGRYVAIWRHAAMATRAIWRYGHCWRYGGDGGSVRPLATGNHVGGHLSGWLGPDNDLRVLLGFKARRRG